MGAGGGEGGEEEPWEPNTRSSSHACVRGMPTVLGVWHRDGGRFGAV